MTQIASLVLKSAPAWWRMRFQHWGKARSIGVMISHDYAVQCRVKDDYCYQALASIVQSTSCAIGQQHRREVALLLCLAYLHFCILSPLLSVANISTAS